MTLKPWRELAVPHEDVLNGTFQQAEFAADLARVHARNATDEYQDPVLLDVLVDFGAPPTFDQYMGLKFFLEDLLQCQVAVVTRRALKESVRPYVEKEAVRVT